MNPTIWRADLLRALATCETEEERERMAAALGFEKKEETEEREED